MDDYNFRITCLNCEEEMFLEEVKTVINPDIDYIGIKKTDTVSIKCNSCGNNSNLFL